MQLIKRLFLSVSILLISVGVLASSGQYWIKESFSELPKNGTISQSGQLNIVNGRVQEKALMIRDGSVEWMLNDLSEDALIDFWFYPEGWDSFTKEKVVIFNFQVGKYQFELVKASNKDELQINTDGKTLFSYPIYNLFSQPWMDGTRRDLWQHVLIGVSDNSLHLAINGFVVEPKIPIQVEGFLNSISLVGQPGNSFSRLNVIGNTWKNFLPGLRDYYLALLKGEPLIKDNVITVPKVATGPLVNGDFNEEKWSNAVVVSNFTSLKNNSLSGEDVKIYLSYDDDNLYMAIETPYEGELDAKKWNVRDASLWREESYEIFIGQNRDGTNNFCQLVGNPFGDQTDLKSLNINWNGKWNWETSHSENKWIAEFKASFNGLDYASPGDLGVWTFNIFNTKADLSWNWARAYSDPASFGTLRFEKDAPIIQPAKMSLVNGQLIMPVKIRTQEQQKNLVVGMQFYSPGDFLPAVEQVEKVEMNPNSERTIELTLPISTPEQGIVVFYVREDNVDLYYYSVALPEAPKSIRYPTQATTASKTIVESRDLTEKELAYQRTWTAEELGETLLESTLWKDNDLGYSDQVPEPWVPMEYSGQSIKLLGRTYTYSNSLLPVQITSLDKDLFVTSPMFQLNSEGKQYTFAEADVVIQKISDALIRVTATSEDGPFSLKLVTDYEFDGMGKIELLLDSPEGPSNVESLYLIFPMDAELAELYHFSSAASYNPPFSNSGALPLEGIQLDSFREILWVGDHDVGFSWFAEGMMDWQLKDEVGIQVFGPENNGARDLSIKLADNPFQLDEPLKLVFGIQATPYKPRKGNWRELNDTRSIDWSWFWGDGTYYPFHNSYTDEAKEHVEDARTNGKEVMPCSSLMFFGTSRFHYGPFGELLNPGMIHPEMLIWGDLWKMSSLNLDVSIPEKHTASGDWYGKNLQPSGGANIATLCPQSSFQDYYIWKLSGLIDDTGLGSIYLDQPLKSCNNPVHGCGYINYKGEWTASSPIFSIREMVKRLYNLFYEKHGTTNIKWHSSNHLIIPAMSFADTFWDGEPYLCGAMKVEEFYSELLDEERIQVQNFGKQFGYAPDFLPEFEDRFAPSVASIKDMMGLFMIHDSTVYPVHSNNNGLIRWIQWKRLDNLADNMDRIYYWENDHRIGINNENVKYIVEYNSDKALLILFNWSDASVTVDVNLSIADLNIPQKVDIKDLLAERAILNNSDGNFSISIQPRDFRMLLLQ